MNNRNSCYTYFKIVGDFDPDKVTKLLNLKPEKSWKIGDYRKNGTQYDFAHWEIGRCSEYDPIVDRQMISSISILYDKIDILNKIREENNVSFYLEVVPVVYANEPSPCLAPSLEVIDFCHITRTEIDIDLYLGD
ncbi:MAG: DUF4279 domain-containing protein [Clostridia bacterium]|nr:DUF4279 domain-containing protein [Clostridia bacterium]